MVSRTLAIPNAALLRLLQASVIASPRIFWPVRYKSAYTKALSDSGLAEDGRGWIEIVAPQHAMWLQNPARAEDMYTRAKGAVAALCAQRRAIVTRIRGMQTGSVNRYGLMSALLAPPSVSVVLSIDAVSSSLATTAAAVGGIVGLAVASLRTARAAAMDAAHGASDTIACIAPSVTAAQLRFGTTGFSGQVGMFGASATAQKPSPPLSSGSEHPTVSAVAGWVESDVPLIELAELVQSVAKRSSVVKTSVVLNGLLGRQLSDVVQVWNASWLPRYECLRIHPTSLDDL